MAKVKVRYNGISDERSISKQDLKGTPWEGAIEKTLVWNRSNLFSLTLDANDEFIEMLRAQEHFTISEVKDDGETGEVIAVASNPDNPGDVVADGATGAKSAAKK